MSTPLLLSIYRCFCFSHTFLDLWFLSVQKLQQCQTTTELLIKLAGGGRAIVLAERRACSKTGKKVHAKYINRLYFHLHLLPFFLLWYPTISDALLTGRPPFSLNQDFAVEKSFNLEILNFEQKLTAACSQLHLSPR